MLGSARRRLAVGTAAVMLAAGFGLVPAWADGPPANDHQAHATAVDVVPFTASQSTDGATDEPGEPDPTCAPMGASVWYSLTTSPSSTVTVSTEGSGFDTVVSVYRDDAGTLTEVGCDDDGASGFSSQVAVAAKNSQRYLIQVGGYLGETGSLAFAVTGEGGSGGGGSGSDSVAGATVIESLPHATTADLTQATVEPGEPSCGFYTVRQSLWWRYTPSEDHAIRIVADDWLSRIALYRGASSPSDVAQCSSGYTTDVDLEAGTTYWIQLATYSAYEPMNVEMQRIDRPANDHIADAEHLDEIGDTAIPAIGNATVEAGERGCLAPGLTDPASRTVWYTLRLDSATEPVLVRAIDDDEWYSYTHIGVYSGAPGDLAQVACSQLNNTYEGSAASFVAEAGVTYYVQLFRWYHDPYPIDVHLSVERGVASPVAAVAMDDDSVSAETCVLLCAKEEQPLP